MDKEEVVSPELADQHLLGVSYRPMRRYLLLFVAFALLITLPGSEAQTQRKTGTKTGTKSSQKKPPSQIEAPTVDGSEPSAPVKEDLKRLILTDGSYQGIVKYQIIGDRVHYLSSERYVWEDIPSSLINWEASRKYMAALEADKSRAREIDAQAKKEQQEEDANAPTVSPGLKLPPTGGIYLLDVYQNKPELNELEQNGADVKTHKAGNILRATINPIASAKQTIELAGPHAKVQAHVGDPFIYVFLDREEDSPYTSDPTKQRDHWRIVKVEEKKGNRIVGNINIAVYGKVKEKAEYAQTEVTPVSGRWIKIAPVSGQLLPPGEYALVEILGQEGMNRFVWDFGVNPNAPANTGVWRPQTVKTDAPNEKDPELNKR